MAREALRLVETTGLEGLATVEFLVRDASFYFLEINPRLQVEHTVTEMITGWDLVKEQLRLAAGERVEEAPPPRGHAVEARLYGIPSGGEIRLHLPGGPGIRVDAPGTVLTPSSTHYDPLLAKICAWAPCRQEALSRLRRALQEAAVEGARTNLNILRKAVESRSFREGAYHTLTLEEILRGKTWFDEAGREEAAGARCAALGG
jgi:acetyl/propionyl-CoA carboxylase alpha subunit